LKLKTKEKGGENGRVDLNKKKKKKKKKTKGKLRVTYKQ
jgi:hypothetical protein